jgi:two-component system nitrate/nitrite response regulator NarL
VAPLTNRQNRNSRARKVAAFQLPLIRKFPAESLLVPVAIYSHIGLSSRSIGLLPENIAWSFAYKLAHSESAATMDSFQILLVDAHQLSREGLRRMLDGKTHHVIGVAPSLDDAADQISKGLAPDVLLYALEEMVPGDQGAIITLMRGKFLDLKIVILANSVSSSLLSQAINAGVNAFLLRDMSLEALSRSIELVMLGQQIFPTQAVLALVGNRGAGPTYHGKDSPSEPALRSRGISGREGDILRSLLNGHSNKSIARQLGISEATVKVHLKAVMRKVNAQNRTQAAVWGLANGFGEDVNDAKTAAA